MQVVSIKQLHTEDRCYLRFVEGLDGLSSLVQLDLSENNIRFVEGLSNLPQLTTLNLSKNALSDAASINHLRDCKALSSLDLSKNDIIGEDVIDCLAGITKLASLNIAGNPVMSKVASFRKKMIVASTSLRYLDRPIFKNERAAAQAWSVGGIEAETKVKEEWQEQQRSQQRRATQEFRDWQASVRIESSAAPRFEVAEYNAIPELPPKEDIDGIVTYCDELKTSYLSEHNTPELDAEEVSHAPLFRDLSQLEDSTLIGEDSESTASQPFNEVISDTTNEPTTEKKVTFDVDEAPPPEFSSNCVEKIDNSEVIRGSIAMLKNCKPNDAQQARMSPFSWTSDMDQALISKVEECGDDFEAVVLAMSSEFGGDATIDFAEQCERRFGLLEISVQQDFVKELAVPDESPNFPSSDKPLASFLNEDGSIKSIDQLRRDSQSVGITPLTLSDAQEDDDMENFRAFGRKELWSMLESSHEQEQSKHDEVDAAN